MIFLHPGRRPGGRATPAVGLEVVVRHDERPVVGAGFVVAGAAVYAGALGHPSRDDGHPGPALFAFSLWRVGALSSPGV